MGADDLDAETLKRLKREAGVDLLTRGTVFLHKNMDVNCSL